MSWQDELRDAIAAIPLALEQVRSELSAGLGEYHNGLRLQGARAVTVGAGGRDLASAGSGRLVGWSLRATGGEVVVTLRDGRDDSGDPLAVLELDGAALGPACCSTQWIGPGGVSFVEGLYLDAAGAGTLTGSVWLGAVD